MARKGNHTTEKIKKKKKDVMNTKAFEVHRKVLEVALGVIIMSSRQWKFQHNLSDYLCWFELPWKKSLKLSFKNKTRLKTQVTLLKGGKPSDGWWPLNVLPRRKSENKHQPQANGGFVTPAWLWICNQIIGESWVTPRIQSDILQNSKKWEMHKVTRMQNYTKKLHILGHLGASLG